MKKYSDKIIEVMVEPYAERSYAIYYREKKRFNLLNPWNLHCYTWQISIDHFDPDQPYLWRNFDEAVTEGKKLKNNPSLIDENNIKRWSKYERCKKELEEFLQKRHKSVIL